METHFKPAHGEQGQGCLPQKNVALRAWEKVCKGISKITLSNSFFPLVLSFFFFFLSKIGALASFPRKRTILLPAKHTPWQERELMQTHVAETENFLDHT